MVKAPRKNRRRATSLRTQGGRQASSASKPRRQGQALKITPALEAEFEALVSSMDDAVTACIRLRRWDDLEGLLTFYNETTGSEGAFWLHVCLFRGAVRHVKTLSDPGLLARWAEFVLQGYELVKSGVGLREAIDAMIAAQVAGPAIDAFDKLDGTTVLN